MKPEAQLIALLEWMGWKFVDDKLTGRPPFTDESIYQRTGNKQRPPLTLDLMHEAENKFTEREAWLYRDLLQDMVIATQPDGRAYRSTHFLYGATKEQRLESLLKTLNLWNQ